MTGSGDFGARAEIEVGVGEGLTPEGVSYRVVDYLGLVVIARKTRSSTGTEVVKTVEVLASGRAICFAKPLRAGPAGFGVVLAPSPG